MIKENTITEKYKKYKYPKNQWKESFT